MIQSRAFGQAWKEEAVDYINKLRKKSIIPTEAESISWRLHLHMGQSSLTRLKEPTAIFQIGLKSTSETSPKNVLLAHLSSNCK
jgi:hypothetical protein